jgi:hypothetical protein
MKASRWLWIGLAITIGLALALGVSRASSAGQPQAQSPSAPVGTAFSYQGRLTDGGKPANGRFDFEFRLYSSPTSTLQVGGTISLPNIPVTSGLFNVYLGFGDVFNGTQLYLETRVRLHGSPASFTLLNPRQPLNAAPYASYAMKTGSGGGWQLSGNAGTNPAVNYLGTIDPVTLTLKVGGMTALRLAPNLNSPGIIGGFERNRISPGTVGAVIGGGGSAPFPNQVDGNFGVVSGGEGNRTQASWAAVGGGRSNSALNEGATIGGGEHINATGFASTVAGGYWITVTGNYASVGGGVMNSVSNIDSVIGGGVQNSASGPYAVIGGGWGNVAGGSESTVSGGAFNTAADSVSTVGGGAANKANGYISTIGGGNNNIAEGEYSTIGGGASITVTGAYGSVAGGREISVTGDYAAVGGGWDNVASGVYSVIGGGGGYAFGAVPNSATGDWSTVGGGRSNHATGPAATVGGGDGNTASDTTATVPGGSENTASGPYSFAAGAQASATHIGSFVWSSSDATASWGDFTFTARAPGGARFYSSSPGTSTGVQLSAGGTSWGSLSDRNVKENFAVVNSQWLLDQLATMPIQTWNLKSQAADMRHIGPVAQDFNSLLSPLFGTVEDPLRINNMDAVGVSLAAIQGLYAQNQSLKDENTALKSQLSDLEKRVSALETGKSSSSGDMSLARELFPWIACLGLGLVWVLRAKGGRDEHIHSL